MSQTRPTATVSESVSVLVIDAAVHPPVKSVTAVRVPLDALTALTSSQRDWCNNELAAITISNAP